MRWVRSILAMFGLIILSVLMSSFMTVDAHAATPGDVGTWSTGTPLPSVKAYSGSVAYNGYVYVLGGFNGDSTAVYYAPLNPDGSVGSWVTSSNALPTGLYGTVAVVNNGYVYVIGGYGGSHSSDVFYAPLNSDGSVGTWTAGTDIPAAMVDISAAVNNGYLYLTGGNDGTGEFETVYYAQFNSNGSISNWTASDPMPIATSGARSVVDNNYLYVIGGWNLGTALDTVRYAPLNNDGSVGSWQTAANNMPAGLVMPSVVTHRGYLFVLGGFDGSAQDEVYSAAFNSDGSIGDWLTSPNSLPAPTYGAASSEYNGFVYMIGGVVNSSISDSTYFAQLTGLPIPDPIPSPDVQPTQPIGGETLADTGQNATLFVALGLIILSGGILLGMRRLHRS